MVSSRQNDAFALFISARESPTGPLEPGDRRRGRSFLRMLAEIEAKYFPLSGLWLLLVPIPPDFWPSHGPILFSLVRMCLILSAMTVTRAPQGAAPPLARRAAAVGPVLSLWRCSSGLYFHYTASCRVVVWAEVLYRAVCFYSQVMAHFFFYFFMLRWRQEHSRTRNLYFAHQIQQIPKLLLKASQISRICLPST